MNVKHLWPLAIVVIGIGATAIGAAISHHYWSFFGLLLIISLASMLSGALLGFLFGVPRLNRNYDPREDYGRTTKYLPNTNLEDVSDWLTKIIIGITLTQLAKIPDYLQGIADYVTANSSCAGQDCHLAGPVIVSLLVYFFIAGFLSGYYYTRIFLPTLFSIMEENSILRAETAIWRKGGQILFSASGGSGLSSRFESLTGQEKAMLQRIREEGTLGRLSHDDSAALNVLLAKGVVESSPGKRSWRIIDEEVLRLLQED
jgi:hypothetical protein